MPPRSIQPPAVPTTVDLASLMPDVSWAELDASTAARTRALLRGEIKPVGEHDAFLILLMQARRTHDPMTLLTTVRKAVRVLRHSLEALKEGDGGLSGSSPSDVRELLLSLVQTGDKVKIEAVRLAGKALTELAAVAALRSEGASEATRTSLLETAEYCLDCAPEPPQEAPTSVRVSSPDIGYISAKLMALLSLVLGVALGIHKGSQQTQPNPAAQADKLGDVLRALMVYIGEREQELFNRSLWKTSKAPPLQCILHTLARLIRTLSSSDETAKISSAPLTQGLLSASNLLVTGLSTLFQPEQPQKGTKEKSQLLVLPPLNIPAPENQQAPSQQPSQAPAQTQLQSKAASKATKAPSKTQTVARGNSSLGSRQQSQQGVTVRQCPSVLTRGLTIAANPEGKGVGTVLYNDVLLIFSVAAGLLSCAASFAPAIVMSNNSEESTVNIPQEIVEWTEKSLLSVLHNLLFIVSGVSRFVSFPICRHTSALDQKVQPSFSLLDALLPMTTLLIDTSSARKSTVMRWPSPAVGALQGPIRIELLVGILGKQSILRKEQMDNVFVRDVVNALKDELFSGNMQTVLALGTGVRELFGKKGQTTIQTKPFDSFAQTPSLFLDISNVLLTLPTHSTLDSPVRDLAFLTLSKANELAQQTPPCDSECCQRTLFHVYVTSLLYGDRFSYSPLTQATLIGEASRHARSQGDRLKLNRVLHFINTSDPQVIMASQGHTEKNLVAPLLHHRLLGQAVGEVNANSKRTSEERTKVGVSSPKDNKQEPGAVTPADIDVLLNGVPGSNTANPKGKSQTINNLNIEILALAGNLHLMKSLQPETCMAVSQWLRHRWETVLLPSLPNDGHMPPSSLVVLLNIYQIAVLFQLGDMYWELVRGLEESLGEGSLNGKAEDSCCMTFARGLGAGCPKAIGYLLQLRFLTTTLNLSYKGECDNNEELVLKTFQLTSQMADFSPGDESVSDEERQIIAEVLKTLPLCVTDLLAAFLLDYKHFYAASLLQLLNNLRKFVLLCVEICKTPQEKTGSTSLVLWILDTVESCFREDKGEISIPYHINILVVDTPSCETFGLIHIPRQGSPNISDDDAPACILRTRLLKLFCICVSTIETGVKSEKLDPVLRTLLRGEYKREGSKGDQLEDNTDIDEEETPWHNLRRQQTNPVQHRKSLLYEVCRLCYFTNTNITASNRVSTISSIVNSIGWILRRPEEKSTCGETLKGFTLEAEPISAMDLKFILRSLMTAFPFIQDFGSELHKIASVFIQATKENELEGRFCCERLQFAAVELLLSTISFNELAAPHFTIMRNRRNSSTHWLQSCLRRLCSFHSPGSVSEATLSLSSVPTIALSCADMEATGVNKEAGKIYKRLIVSTETMLKELNTLTEACTSPGRECVATIDMVCAMSSIECLPIYVEGRSDGRVRRTIPELHTPNRFVLQVQVLKLLIDRTDACGPECCVAAGISPADLKNQLTSQFCLIAPLLLNYMSEAPELLIDSGLLDSATRPDTVRARVGESEAAHQRRLDATRHIIAFGMMKDMCTSEEAEKCMKSLASTTETIKTFCSELLSTIKVKTPGNELRNKRSVVTYPSMGFVSQLVSEYSAELLTLGVDTESFSSDVAKVGQGGKDKKKPVKQLQSQTASQDGAGVDVALVETIKLIDLATKEELQWEDIENLQLIQHLTRPELFPQGLIQPLMSLSLCKAHRTLWITAQEFLVTLEAEVTKCTEALGSSPNPPDGANIPNEIQNVFVLCRFITQMFCLEHLARWDSFIGKATEFAAAVGARQPKDISNDKKKGRAPSDGKIAVGKAKQGKDGGARGKHGESEEVEFIPTELEAQFILFLRSYVSTLQLCVFSVSLSLGRAGGALFGQLTDALMSLLSSVKVGRAAAPLGKQGGKPTPVSSSSQQKSSQLSKQANQPLQQQQQQDKISIFESDFRHPLLASLVVLAAFVSSAINQYEALVSASYSGVFDAENSALLVAKGKHGNVTQQKESLDKETTQRNQVLNTIVGLTKLTEQRDQTNAAPPFWLSQYQDTSPTSRGQFNQQMHIDWVIQNIEECVAEGDKLGDCVKDVIGQFAGAMRETITLDTFTALRSWICEIGERINSQCICIQKQAQVKRGTQVEMPQPSCPKPSFVAMHENTLHNKVWRFQNTKKTLTTQTTTSKVDTPNELERAVGKGKAQQAQIPKKGNRDGALLSPSTVGDQKPNQQTTITTSVDKFSMKLSSYLVSPSNFVSDLMDLDLIHMSCAGTSVKLQENTTGAEGQNTPGNKEIALVSGEKRMDFRQYSKTIGDMRENISFVSDIYHHAPTAKREAKTGDKDDVSYPQTLFLMSPPLSHYPFHIAWWEKHGTPSGCPVGLVVPSIFLSLHDTTKIQQEAAAKQQPRQEAPKQGKQQQPQRIVPNKIDCCARTTSLLFDTSNSIGNVIHSSQQISLLVEQQRMNERLRKVEETMDSQEPSVLLSHNNTDTSLFLLSHRNSENTIIVDPLSLTYLTEGGCLGQGENKDVFVLPGQPRDRNVAILMNDFCGEKLPGLISTKYGQHSINSQVSFLSKDIEDAVLSFVGLFKTVIRPYMPFPIDAIPPLISRFSEKLFDPSKLVTGNDTNTTPTNSRSGSARAKSRGGETSNPKRKPQIGAGKPKQDAPNEMIAFSLKQDEQKGEYIQRCFVESFDELLASKGASSPLIQSHFV